MRTRWVDAAADIALRAVLAIVLLTVLVFVLMRFLAPDPVTTIAGIHTDLATRERLIDEFGLAETPLRTYVRQVTRYLSLDLGRSWRSGMNVSSLIERPLILSLAMSVGAASLMGLVSLFVVIRRAASSESNARRTDSFAISALAAVPSYLLALFVSRSGLPEIVGVPSHGVSGAGISQAAGLFLPIACIFLPLAPYAYGRAQAACADVVAQEWFRTARSVGRSRFAALVVHGRSVIWVAVMDVVIYGIIVSFTSAVPVEFVFGLPGIGTTMLDAIQLADMPVVSGITILLGTGVIGLTSIRDLVRALLEGRL